MWFEHVAHMAKPKLKRRSHSKFGMLVFYVPPGLAGFIRKLTKIISLMGKLWSWGFKDI
jgi:hypothetical protein